ncbi:DNA polymerase III subunit alpha [Streptomyces sp. NPDC000927]|uniref:DNA polymerase III subunit alpha n=1 Tax=Streptomyces sp. NPDC000927 TaxID=3154371 RepID=UPI00332D2FBD
MSGFTHLHNHSDRSMLDGLQSPESMAATAARLGQTAIGLTDHGNLHAAYAFHKSCVQHGVTPIIGLEAYLAPGDMDYAKPILWGTPEQKADDVSKGGAYTHLSLWATNETGLRNLYALTTASYTDGMYHKPRIDYTALSQHAEGLVASTGCPGGEVQTRLRLGQHAEAATAAGKLKDIFGKGRIFCELMDHGIAVEKRVKGDLLDLARRMDLPLLATNDTHYSEAHEAATHDALLCVGVRKKISDEERFRFDGTDYYLKSTDEMYGIFSGVESACSNTLLVAEMHEGYGELFQRRDLMPSFPCPDGFTEETLLRRLSTEGLRAKGLDQDRRYADRLQYELDVISTMGFPGYFLIVGDCVAWAKRNGIETGPGRGSAAASLICWVLGITAVDPLVHDLVFERFLNPERVSMPDIDLDFEDKDRVGAYLAEKYGQDRVARISTLMEVKSKNALKDSARVLGAPFAAGDMLTKAMPKDLFGTPAPLSALRDESHPRYSEMDKLRALASEPEYTEIVDLATRLEGTARGIGIHAGGVVVSCRPLALDVPLSIQSGHLVTQYDMNEVESLGLLKIDTLGLITLGTLRRALEATGIDRHDIPEDDAKTWALLGSGHTTGVFQLESPGMQDALRQIKPTSLTDLAAVIALYRPGPLHSIPAYAARKNGREAITPIHPELKDALEKSVGTTYHLLVFQEQVMQAARDVCGWSLGKADLLRRAMGKKDHKKLAVLEPEFYADGMAQGYSREAMQALWDAMRPFADYGFNSAHAVAYGSTGYLAAYLKANFPVEYMTSHLESAASRRDKDEEKDKYLLGLAEVRRMGIKLFPPSIDQAFSGFRTEDGGIRYGLDMIKSVGTAAVDDIAAGAPYESLLDYMVRAGKGKNARVVKALASAGAMDMIGTRKGIIEAAQDMSKKIAQVKGWKKKDNSLTEENVAIPVGTDEYEQGALLDLEKDYLGTYVSSHPLDPYAQAIADSGATQCGDLEALESGTAVTIIGTVSSAAEKTTKNGKPFGSIKVSDRTGDVRFSVWERSRDGAITWGRARELAEPGAVVRVKGVWSTANGFTGLDVKSMARLDGEAAKKQGGPLPDVMLWWGRQGIPVVGQEGRDPSLFGGILQATTDERLIRYMAGHPRATGYGIRCGRSTGILGIDLDVKHGIDGIAEFGKLIEAEDAEIPDTFTTITPSGGRHILVRVPAEAWEWLRSVQCSELGIDLRCEGITGPGSRNESGVYTPGSAARTIADAPAGLLAVLERLCESAPAVQVDYDADVDEAAMRAAAFQMIGDVEEKEIQSARGSVERMLAAQAKKLLAFSGMGEGAGLTGQVYRSGCALGHYVPVYIGWDEAIGTLMEAAMDARPDGDQAAFARSARRGLLCGSAKPERIETKAMRVAVSIEDEEPVSVLDPEVEELLSGPVPAPRKSGDPVLGCPDGLFEHKVADEVDRIVKGQMKKIAEVTKEKDLFGRAWYLGRSLAPFGIPAEEIVELILHCAPGQVSRLGAHRIKTEVQRGYADPVSYVDSY